jgi:HEAT repeat protein
LAGSRWALWFALLLEIAQKNAGILNYLEDAAELGGDRMLPPLIALMSSPDKEFTVVNAVTAMGSTGSRAAVPILLDALRSPDTNVADRARYGLRRLTHRTVSEDQAENSQFQYSKWSQWWTREGATAPIYKARECGDFVPLH